MLTRSSASTIRYQPETRSAEDDWRTDGACLKYYNELRIDDPWFPLSEAPSAAVEGKRICGSCPVQDMCLARALDRKEKHGIFGGMTAKERANLIRRKSRK